MRTELVRAIVASVVCVFLLAGPVLAQQAVRGVTADTITIGVAAPLTKVLPFAGKASVEALRAYFESVNAQGGIHGRKIKLVVGDTQYDPGLSLAEFKKQATRDRVFAFVGWGTAPTTVLIKEAEEEKVPLIAISGAKEFFSPPKKHVFAFITPYPVQAAVVVSYIVEKLGGKRAKLGIFYQNDDYGNSGRAGILVAAKHYNLDVVAEAPYVIGTTVDFTSHVLTLKRAGVDYVLAVGAGGDIVGLLREARSQSLKAPILGALAPTSDRKIVQQAGAAAQGYMAVNAQARFQDTTLPGIAQMLKISEKFAPAEVMKEKSYYYVLGWYPAVTMVEALKRAGKDLTVDGFIRAMESFQNFDVGGIIPPITMSSTRHVVAVGGIMLKANPSTEDYDVASEWLQPAPALLDEILGAK
jgi:branched-chain amino acid transport system substrate-binding protein